MRTDPSRLARCLAVPALLLAVACGGSGGGGTAHTVTATAGAGGSISPGSAAVSDGATATFTVTAEPGQLASVSGCGGSLSSGGTYTTGPITADCTVEATFAAVGAPTLAPQAIKTFHFTWPAVAGATEYRLLEDPDGASGFAEVANAAEETSHDLTVFLPGRVSARYRVRACNGGGCADSPPVAVSGTLASAVGYVKASNAGADDMFGGAVALSADGSTLAVGAYGEDSAATGIGGDPASDAALYSGAVYVFTRSGTGWAQQAYLKASNAGAGDEFGWSVALSADGNTLAVGAYGEASAATGIDGAQANNGAPNSGAVYVFTRSGATWTQQAYVKPSTTRGGEGFGWAVAVSADGNTLVAGAPAEGSSATGIDGNQADGSAPSSGAAYVFARSGASWAQQAYVKASNTGTSDGFGTAVALSGDGDTLAVGAVGEDSGATGIGGDQARDVASSSGAVYVFARSGTSWAQQAYVKASNTGYEDSFGTAVALSADGSTLAVGAEGEDSDAAGIGGDQENDDLSSSGAVYVFVRSGTSWTQQAYVKASNPGGDDRFGYAVAFTADGNTLAASAYTEASAATGIGGDQASDGVTGAGAVYVFARSGTSWAQRAYVKAPNTGTSDYFGGTAGAVALSADGRTLAVGAYGECGAATGIGGDQTSDAAVWSGAVYLY